VPTPQDGEPRGWTTAEAAFILEEPLDLFKKVVDRSPVKPQVVKQGGGLKVRTFAFDDLVFLHALTDLIKAFTPETRENLYVALKRTPRDKLREVALGSLKYDLRSHVQFVQVKTRQLDQLARQIDTSGGEAVIKGTSIAAHRIAALLDGGTTVAEVLADYPSLKEHQVLAAKAYAEANPKPGRPYPKTTAKAALRSADLSGLGAFLDPKE